MPSCSVVEPGSTLNHWLAVERVFALHCLCTVGKPTSLNELLL